MSDDWSEYLGDVGASIGRYIDSFEQRLRGPDHGQDTDRFYNPDMETAEPEELDELIQDRLQWTAEYAVEESEYWADRFDEAGLEPQDLEGPADLLELGSLDKQEFLSRQPPESDDYEWFVDPDGQSSHMFCTSGSTGVEKWIAVNEDDAELSDEAVRRGYAASGLDDDTVLANFLPKGPYMSGKQSEDAAEGYVSMHQAFGHMNTPPRDRLFDQFNGTGAAPDALFGAPSTAERIARELEDRGLDPAEIGIDNLMMVGEPSSEERREAIAETYDADITNNYANTELGFTAYQSVDCDVDGMHVIEDLRLVMVVDEDGDEPTLTDPGETGEVWVTPLYPEGMKGSTPMFNYRPGDQAENLGREACGCGRTNRMLGTVARSDDTKTANNAKINPHHIEDIIHQDHYRDILTGEYEVNIGSQDEKDQINIRVDVRPDEHINYDALTGTTADMVDEDDGGLEYAAIEDMILDEFLEAHVGPRAFSQGDLMDVEVDVLDTGELDIYDEPGKPTRIRTGE